MTRLRSLTDWTGTEYNGVVLGEPAVEDGWYIWGDSEQLPDGVIDSDGYVFVEGIKDATVQP